MSDRNRAGLSIARLQKIDRIFQEQFVDPGYLPGTLIQVWRAGELAHTGMTGMIDRERNKAMREDAIFRIYSMTKPIIGAAILMLVEEGRLDLHQDVTTIIPAFEKLRVYTGGERNALETAPLRGPMRVIDLLTHTAGFVYGNATGSPVEQAYADVGVVSKVTKGGLETMIEQLSELPLLFSPGEAWNYSISIDVLGYIIQKVSGKPLGEFLQERVFTPLGMVDTGFYCPPDKMDRFAACYQAAPDGSLSLQDDPPSGTYTTPPALESGGGGLVSTAGDYMRFCRMLLGKGALGDVRLLSPKSVALFGVNFLPGGREVVDLAVPSLAFNENGHPGLGYSIATAVDLDLARTRLPGTVGTFFWSGAASTHFWVDPKEDLTVVFMTQVMALPKRIPLRRILRTSVYSAIAESYV